MSTENDPRTGVATAVRFRLVGRQVSKLSGALLKEEQWERAQAGNQKWRSAGAALKSHVPLDKVIQTIQFPICQVRRVGTNLSLEYLESLPDPKGDGNHLTWKKTIKRMEQMVKYQESIFPNLTPTYQVSALAKHNLLSVLVLYIWLHSLCIVLLNSRQTCKSPDYLLLPISPILPFFPLSLHYSYHFPIFMNKRN